MKLLVTLDGFGVYGIYYHYSMVIAFVLSAGLIFFHLWKKGSLHMDEDPKFLLLKDDELSDTEENNEQR